MKLPYIAFFLLALAFGLRADVSVSPLFSDHAVLLKDAVTPVWGKADPGEKVKVTLDGATAKTETGADGRWRVTLDLRDKAAGPFELIIEGKNKLTIRDVVVGEVWVCSGQSNMEWPLVKTLGAKEEIAGSANPMLRHFAVKKTTSMTPLEDVAGRWVVAGPSTSGNFTAIGYWFGKTLNRELNAPVGLIHSSWGGTPSEAWTSAAALDTDPHLKARREELFDLLRKAPALKAAYPREMAAWVEAHRRQDRPAQDVSALASGPADGWTKVRLPGKVAGPGLPAAGVVWVRREVDVPPASAGRDAKLEFALPDAFASVWWDGRKISGHAPDTYPGIGRTVTIPAAEVREGKAMLALRVHAPVATAEFTGDDNRIRLFGKSLAGTWLAKTEQAFPDLDDTILQTAPRMPKDPPPQQVAAHLYNGMIAPLIPCAIRGVIWYQGENNGSRAFAYRTAFPLLISDWRAQWGRGDFPFYFCQLANCWPKSRQPGNAAWAELREAQSMARRLPNTGMAVLIDLGETKDVHPRNKKDAGERLAAIALVRDYGKRVPFAGPAFESLKIEENRAVVRFRNTEGGLIARPLPPEELYRSMPRETGPLDIPRPNSELQGFAICGEDRQWKWADAKIEGDTVVVSSEAVSRPVAVRYAWASNPTCNLYNQAGFPAEPFRTDDFPMITADRKY